MAASIQWLENQSRAPSLRHESSRVNWFCILRGPESQGAKVALFRLLRAVSIDWDATRSVVLRSAASNLGQRTAVLEGLVGGHVGGLINLPRDLWRSVF